MELTKEPLLIAEKNDAVSMQVLYYMFTANVLFCTFCMMVGAIPYYHYFGFLTTRNMFGASVTVMVVSYVTVGVLIVLKHVDLALWCLFIWAISMGLLTGFASALTYNIAPIQFMAMWWSQSIAIVAFTRYNTREINVNKATIAMTIVTLAVWCASIYGFIVEWNWIAAIIIIILALAMVFYNRIQIQRTIGRYDTSWEQGVTAVCQYYCFDLVTLMMIKE